MTTDDIITGRIFIHQFEKHLLDARTFLIDGIIERIHQMVHALDNLLLIHQLRRGHIITCQFLAIIRQPLELDALRMRQKQQIHSLMHRLQLHLLVIILQDKTIILRDDQPTQPPLGSLNAQLFEQRHTNGFQQQVLTPLCLQLPHESFHLLGHLFWRKHRLTHSVTPFIRSVNHFFHLSSIVGSRSSSSSSGSGVTAGSGSGACSTLKSISCCVAITCPTVGFLLGL